MSVREFAYTRDDFERVRRWIYQVAGIALADIKFDLVYSRLARRLRACGYSEFSAYLDFAHQNADETRECINALTTNLTAFFREPHHFDYLHDFLQQRQATPVRIWCGAASTGEEPYSIAITAMEAYESLNPPVQILATDLDTQVLEHGRTGVYEEERIANLSPERKRLFFLRGRNAHTGRVRVRPELQALIRFRQLNLLAGKWPIGDALDVIFLRNVMIYFDRTTQHKVLAHCARLLKPDGLLFVGHSESLSHASKAFSLIGRTIYRPVPAEVSA